MKDELLELAGQTIKRQHLLREGDACLVALSGGADSVSLLIVLQTLGFRVEAAHCNFHLRGSESLRDEMFCRDLCERLQVPLHVVDFQTKKEAQANGESIEMAARRLRYAWFETLRKERQLDKIAVGHHRDDNIETLLLNLVRGTGIRGLTGMAFERDRIIRPFLNVSRETLLRFLQRRKQDYVTDSTNADTSYKRNFVRNRLLPLLREMNPSVEQTLVGDMRKLQSAEEAYEAVMASTFDAPACPTSTGYVFPVSMLRFRANFDAIGRRFGFAEDVVSLLSQPERCGERALFRSENFLAAYYRDHLEVSRRPAKYSPVSLADVVRATLPDGRTISVQWLPREALVEIPHRADQVALDADKIVGDLMLRRPENGERFTPFGLRGSKLVSDFLTNRHVSQIQRLWTAVVADSRGILWLVGHRPDQRGAISPGTKRVLLLKLEA